MIRIIGHRGGRNLWAENSLGGFRKTARLGVDAVELDLHLTQDGEIVVIHDPLLERTTNGRGAVSDHSLQALTRLRLKDTIDETIPTLAQVLDVFEPTGLALELEIKTDARGLPYPALIEKTRTVVSDGTGQYRITDLTPGDYVLTFSLPGFTTVIRDGLAVLRRAVL